MARSSRTVESPASGSSRPHDAEGWVKEGLHYLLAGDVEAAGLCQARAEDLDQSDWNALQLGLMVTRLKNDELGGRALFARLVDRDQPMMPRDPGRASALLQFFDLSGCLDLLERHFETDSVLADGAPTDVGERHLVIIPGQPRSASRSIVAAVRERFGLPPLPTVDIPLMGRQPFSSWTLLARRLMHLRRRGGLPHTHAAVTARNLRTLDSMGASRLCVTVRDPRQGFYSYLHGWLEEMRRDRAIGLYFMGARLTRDMLRATPDQLAETCIRATYPDYLRWLEGWVALSEQTRDVRLVRFEDVAEDPAAQIDAVGRHLGLTPVPGSGPAHALPAVTRRRGQTDEFRRALPRPLLALLQELTPQRLLDRCGWPR